MRSPHCREEVTRSPDQTTTVASLQGFRRLKRSSLARKVGSEGAARRRGASRVPQMCPKCVRLFDQQTTTKCRFAGTLLKPSDGLEPSTPSLPWRFPGGIGVHGRALAITFCLQIGHVRCVVGARPCPRVLKLMYPPRTRGVLPILATSVGPRRVRGRGRRRRSRVSCLPRRYEQRGGVAGYRQEARRRAECRCRSGRERCRS
jgi:hypothetical protein